MYLFFLAQDGLERYQWTLPNFLENTDVNNDRIDPFIKVKR